MKLYKWLYGAFALTMLGACSDHDLLPGEGSENNGGGSSVSGYLAVEIKLPQEVTSRAGSENDQYDDGEAYEYAVSNAMIVLFKGQNENDAKFYRAQDLTKPFFSNVPENDPISASYIAAIPVQDTNISTTDSYYALVILNRNEKSVTIDDEDGNSTLTIAGKTMTAGTTTFSTFKGYITDNSFLGSDQESKFFMINAPMSSKRAGEDCTAGDISYLTKLGRTIYDTPEEAKAKVSGCVYVERAVAKVTCSALKKENIKLSFIGEDGNEIKDLEEAGISVDATVRYALSNTPKNSYIIRNVDFTQEDNFSWNMSAPGQAQRMLGTVAIPGLSEPFHSEESKLYRTYWCKDPHYNKAMAEDERNVVTSAADFKSLDKTIYCKENTFQVRHMEYQNSNVAVFEVEFQIRKNGKKVEDLYIRDGNTSKIFLSPESAYAEGIARIVNDVNVQNALKSVLKAGNLEDFSVKDHLNIEIGTETNEDGITYLIIRDIKLDTTKDAEKFKDNAVALFDNELGANKNALLINVNALDDITVYEGGKSYYMKPIMHFGEIYTPWDKDIKGTTTEDVYNNGSSNWGATAANSYLGRYGMVRNNWYELSINSITALGSSIIPDTTIDLSDDNNEDKKYFSVEIHILSWAKRFQGIDF